MLHKYSLFKSIRLSNSTIHEWLVATLVVHGVDYVCDDVLYAHVYDGHAHACDDALHYVCDGGAYVRVLEQELVLVHSPVKLNLQAHFLFQAQVVH
ncbi:hypothetical protein L1987_37023 [Smallanthus sonchifolius]|uniref:Uncharacterized protein n=1 Tax=Smallanthus sonchifolius TaxID=185202 RepID=A0ACB9HF62_9ASTR|nr:hypothetical protein L1987_37023 [Smallanthus sonchifolius]